MTIRVTWHDRLRVRGFVGRPPLAVALPCKFGVSIPHTRGDLRSSKQEIAAGVFAVASSWVFPARGRLFPSVVIIGNDYQLSKEKDFTCKHRVA